MSITENINNVGLEIKEKLKEINNISIEIKRLALVNNYKEEIETLNSELKQELLGFNFMAKMALDDNGKKKYPNQAERDTYIVEMTKESPQCQSIKKRLQEIEGIKLNNSVELGYLYNKFSILKLHIRAMTQELKTLTVFLEFEPETIKTEVNNVTR